MEATVFIIKIVKIFKLFSLLCVLFLIIFIMKKPLILCEEVKDNEEYVVRVLV